MDEERVRKMLKWNKEEEEEEGRIITKFVQGLEVLLFKGIFEAVVRAR